MADVRTAAQPTTEEQAPTVDTGSAGDVLTSEVLVEEVSIDGMCGVY